MTIQIQKSVCAGLDVHKNNVYAWVCCSVKDPKTNVDVLKLKSKSSDPTIRIFLRCVTGFLR
ncbi:hypothetical protein [Allobaculum sp. Allo2]|uniref:hypothetical protein n=1 Tax=Allobaculum sp. Allo2 TaxID=2853432 RepID=UPI001F604DFF|nr:hypothetical protein [Allobaculum sp. Allo2]UNT92980.1 hypothetical protein KWG61_13150 [Allobaculum sp. Allo2]